MARRTALSRSPTCAPFSLMGAVTSAKVADNSLSGDDIDESSLARTSPEPWHYIGAEGEPQFESGWGNAVSVLTEAVYYVVDADRVYLK